MDLPNRTEGPVRIPGNTRALLPPTSISQSRCVPGSQSRLCTVVPVSEQAGAEAGERDLPEPQNLLFRTFAFEAPSWQRTLRVMRTEGT